MSAPPVVQPPPGAAPVPNPQQRISPARLAWLQAQLGAWVAGGIVDGPTADRILGHYRAQRRFSLVVLWISLGSAFVAAGLIWAVAANLDLLSPLGRFGVVAALWVGLTVLVEWLAQRSATGRDGPSVLVEFLRLLPTAAFCAAVFQAAQSLHVPAFEPVLLLMCALGALVYAYAVRGGVPLTVGIVLLAAYSIWAPMASFDGVLALTTAFFASAVAGVGIAGLHRLGWWPQAGLAWREIAVALTLISSFIAALPFGFEAHPDATVLLLIGPAFALALAVAGAAVGTWVDRAAIILVGAAAVLGTLLRTWVVPDVNLSDLSAQTYARAAVAVLFYLAVAVGTAVLGAVADSQRIAAFASVALAIFMTFQAFAVFAPIMPGSILFLTVGTVLLLTGWLANRGRRELFQHTRAATRRERRPS